ncbi:TPA: archaeosortase/exosortase family protein [Candidatus Woesearchaeota archaeon]|nr:archaeosortase/exosortase family protein [Candidatus Woesearchaeota archaeon]
MKNPLKNKSIREITIRSIIIVLVLLGINYLLSTFWTSTVFYKTYVINPLQFQVLPLIQKIIFVNAVIFGIVAFLIKNYRSLKKEQIPKFEFTNLSFLILGIVFLVLHNLFKFMLRTFPDFFNSMPQFWGWIKISIFGLYVVCVIISLFGLRYSVDFVKKYYKSILAFILLTLVFLGLMYVVQSLWTVFSSGVAGTLNEVFKLFYDDVYYRSDPRRFSMIEGGGPKLGVGSFIVGIGKPCSGIDSMLLFISLYILIIIMDWKKINKKTAAILFIIGAIGMYITNIFRIFMLFLVGIYISPKLAVGVFHTNIGWILFIIFFFIYWNISSRFIYKKKGKK